jgi:seryl-tRNA synthetase
VIGFFHGLRKTRNADPKATLAEFLTDEDWNETWELVGQMGKIWDKCQARAKGQQHIADERAAWQADFPNIPYDNVTTCASQHHPKEVELFDAWRRGRQSMKG